ncbi:MAG: ABC transporter transmembrane domain-containing protein, partial [Planctomycetota bacterium]
MGLSALRYLLPFVRAYRPTYALGLGCLVVAIALRLAIPVLLGGAIDELRGMAGELDSPGATVDDGRFVRLVGEAALYIVGAALIGSVFRTASRFTILGTCRRVVHDVRQHLFGKLTRLAPSFYLRYTTGQLMSRGMNDVQNVQGLTGPVFMYITETAILYVLGVALMVATDPVLTLWTLALFPLFIWRARVLAKSIQEGSRAAQDALGDVSEKVGESLSGQLVIKTLGLEQFDLGRFEEHAESYRSLNLRVTKARTRLMPMMMALVGISLGIALVVGRGRVESGAITAGQLVSFIFFVRYLAAPTATLGFVISSLQRGAAALTRIQEIFDAGEALPRPAGALEAPADHTPRGAIEVRRLSVVREGLVAAASQAEKSTEGRGEPELQRRTVLHDLSFEVRPGQTLAIVGPTGAGKSTLVEVLARLLEVDAGTLFFDGREASTLDPLSLRDGLGWVPQEAFL